MLRPRIIPCLLIQDKGLVKTINFKSPKYVGDPINTVRIFNEKAVDELITLDIDATPENREPDYNMIAHLAEECRMPLCYGGGVKSIEQVKTIIGLGVEKVAISSAALENPALIEESSKCVGNQSVVVVLDVKKRPMDPSYEIFTHNAKNAIGRDPVKTVRQMENLGAGEIVINSIDNDGVMKGYDLDLVAQIIETISIPLTVLGGAGSLDDIGQLINKFGTIGCAAGSLFVFKGTFRAVLINYPNSDVKDNIIKNSQPAFE